MNNPFAVQTPEGMAAKDAVSLFVDVFTDFPKILREGHTFLHGPRGSGKSMMYRYLEPDCQCLKNNCEPRNLEFFGIYIPIKNTDLKITELDRLENQHASTVLNEHLMCIFIATKAFNSLLKLEIQDNQNKYFNELHSFINDTLLDLLIGCGWVKNDFNMDSVNNLHDCFKFLIKLFDNIYRPTNQYIKKLSFPSSAIPYEGPLFGYLDFLHPLLCGIINLSFMPTGPIYLLLDDADNLNLTQTKILNSWVSTRTSSQISLKISTQLNYKTYITTFGQPIVNPHDFSEINISDIYTSSKSKYLGRVRDIVEKRLTLNGIKANAEEFFPVSEKQENEIKIIANEIRKNWEKEGSGYRPSDDVVRYSRPEYIARLKMSKSGSNYSYAGFQQLVHISSGIIRYFLESAALMVGEQESGNKGSKVLFVEPAIQHKIVSEQADKFLFSEFDRMLKEDSDESIELDKPTLLKNLIMALGGTFHQILISKKSERRVFSFAFSNPPDKEILEVLKLGTRFGYFHESTIGNKEGTGRTPLFILSRRLAPHFKLDPTSFAGYLFVTKDQVKEALYNPNKLLNRIRSRGIDDEFDPKQLKLFD